MANTHLTLTSLFGDIADAIRAKTGSSADIVADDFPTAISAISQSGTTISGGARVKSSFVPEVTFSTLTGTVQVDFTKYANVQFYLVIVEAIYFGSGQFDETSAGYGYQLLDPSLNVIDSGKTNKVNSISTVVRTGNNLRTTVTLTKATGATAPDGMRLMTTIYALT
jgi:hypothetical protein